MAKPQSTPSDIVLLMSTAPAKKEEEFYLFDKSPRTDYTYITGVESHLLRRQIILKAHPEIRGFMNTTSYISFYLTIIFVLAQLAIAYLVRVPPF